MRWGAGIEYSLVQVHLLLEVFLCGRRIRTYTSGLLLGVGVSLSARFAQQGFSYPGSRCDGLLCHLLRELQTVGGVLAEGVIDAAVRMACWSESLSAFVGICMVLNRQSSFDLFSQEECRDRAQGVRSEMLVRLTEWRQHNDNIPARRAAALIRAADLGCDNPAEAALLWVVKSVCAFEVVTQYEIVVNGRRYFADIAIPGLMIIFEFDGIGKLGKNEADFAQAKREWIQRENDLRSAGWTIYRVSWPDYEDLVRLRAWVTELLAPYQASIPASAQRLWAVPTQACDGPNRRFHMGASRRRSQGSYT